MTLSTTAPEAAAANTRRGLAGGTATGSVAGSPTTVVPGGAPCETQEKLPAIAVLSQSEPSVAPTNSDCLSAPTGITTRAPVAAPGPNTLVPAGAGLVGSTLATGVVNMNSTEAPGGVNTIGLVGPSCTSHGSGARVPEARGRATRLPAVEVQNTRRGWPGASRHSTVGGVATHAGLGCVRLTHESSTSRCHRPQRLEQLAIMERVNRDLCWRQ